MPIGIGNEPPVLPIHKADREMSCCFRGSCTATPPALHMVFRKGRDTFTADEPMWSCCCVNGCQVEWGSGPNLRKAGELFTYTLRRRSRRVPRGEFLTEPHPEPGRSYTFLRLSAADTVHKSGDGWAGIYQVLPIPGVAVWRQNFRRTSCTTSSAEVGSWRMLSATA